MIAPNENGKPGAARRKGDRGGHSSMQMHDARRQVEGGAVVAHLASAFAITPGQAEAVVRTVMPEFAWYLQRNTLSRGGLADLVEALGSGHHARYLDGINVFSDAAAVVEGNAILGHLLGSEEACRSLARRAGRRAAISEDRVRSMLPGLAAAAMAGLAARAQRGLGEIVSVIPPLGRRGAGHAYAELAAILRRGCGVGPYDSGRLRHMVRWVVARAGGFEPIGPVRWYLDFMVMRLGQTTARRILTRLGRTP